MYLKKKELYLYKVDELEKVIISCILNKPDLMKDERLKDNLFINNQKLWQFLKATYKKFGTLDFNLMFSVVTNRYNYIGMLNEMIDIEPVFSNFNWYIKQLINLHNEEEIEKRRINAIFSMANDLLLRNMTSNEFKKKIDEIFKEDNNE